MIEIILAVLVWYFAPMPWIATIIHVFINKNVFSITNVKIITTLFSMVIGLTLGYWLIFNYQLLFINQFSHLLALGLGVILLIIVVAIEVLTELALGRKRILLSSELRKSKDRLITKGIYKFARHPRYVEHPLLFLGLGLILGYTSLLWFSLYLFISFIITTYFEEQELMRRYGEEYVIYKKKTPAFFIRFD